MPLETLLELAMHRYGLALRAFRNDHVASLTPNRHPAGLLETPQHLPPADWHTTVYQLYLVYATTFSDGEANLVAWHLFHKGSTVHSRPSRALAPESRWAR